MVKLNITLPEHFLEEEERCGHLVTAEMKKIWAIQLDLAVKLLEVCKKHKIRICAASGTMLGAVRHQGFIPWDDDIDMMMERSEYEKLCRVAEKEFQHPYFFQTEYNDPGSLRGHAQLRNSETTAILKTEEGLYRFHQGVFIDIFPLDNLTPDKKAFEKQRKQSLRWRKIAMTMAKYTTRYQLVNAKGAERIFRRMIHPLAVFVDQKFRIQERYYRKFEEGCARFNKEDTDYFATLSLRFMITRHYRLKEDYREFVEMPFEFIRMPIGKNYEHALTMEYGDYKKLVKGSGLHGEVIFDAERPYTEYLQK